MENLKEKVSYLRGLAEGLEVSESSKEGKLLAAMIDVLDEFADSILELEDVQVELDEYVEELDHDLADLEDDFYEDDEDDDYEDEDDEDLEGEYYEIDCPICHDKLVVEEEAFFREEPVECPNCKHEFELKVEGECGCGCGHSHNHEIEEEEK